MEACTLAACGPAERAEGPRRAGPHAGGELLRLPASDERGRHAGRHQRGAGRGRQRPRREQGDPHALPAHGRADHWTPASTSTGHGPATRPPAADHDTRRRESEHAPHDGPPKGTQRHGCITPQSHSTAGPAKGKEKEIKRFPGLWHGICADPFRLLFLPNKPTVLPQAYSSSSGGCAAEAPKRRTMRAGPQARVYLLPLPEAPNAYNESRTAEAKHPRNAAAGRVVRVCEAALG